MAATKQGVEGWTLGLKSSGPHTEGFYILGDRGLVKGVAGDASRGSGVSSGEDQRARREC